VSANIVLWPADVAQGAVYFRALAGPYLDNIPDDMIEVWAAEMHANRAWLEGLGMTPVEMPYVEIPQAEGAECVRILKNGEGPIGGERLWRVIEAAVARRPIAISYQTPAVTLVKHGADVVGVIAERNGKSVSIRVHRAVTLICGGFEANPTMLRTFVEGLPNFHPVGTPYNTGDGIRMASEIGAELWHMNNVSGPILAFKAPEIPVAQWRNLPHGSSYLLVAVDGTRFTMEGEPCSVGDFHGKVEQHGVWQQQKLPAPIQMIFDEIYRLSGHIGKATADWNVVHGNRHAWSNDNMREIEKGWIKKADTVVAIARLIGISPNALDGTVSRFNDAAAQRKDLEWGRTPDSTAALVTPPLHRMELTPALVNRQGGARRNKAAQVSDVDGTRIGRLDSAGELGSIYPFLYQGGGNVGECFAFGRIAGTNAAKEVSTTSAATNRRVVAPA